MGGAESRLLEVKPSDATKVAQFDAHFVKRKRKEKVAQLDDTGRIADESRARQTGTERCTENTQ
jgi:hypothetical protein